MRTANPHPETKERLYDAAQALMLDKGFPATTVDEICTRAGLTKGSFFHYFNSKDQLGRELVERDLLARRAEHERLCAEPDPLRRLYRFLDTCIAKASDPAHRHGFLMGMFAQELAARNPDIARLLADAFDRWTERLVADLTEARARYRPQAPFEPRSLANYFKAVMEGSLILAKVHPTSAIVGENLRHFRAYLEMLLGPAD